MNIIDASARQKYMLGGYEILDTLGSGGMGVVYRAQDRALDRQVALKVLRDDLRNHPDIVARFQREAEAFASLDHPNIVHLYSVGAENNVPYFAMEFIEGTTLSERVIMDGPMPWDMALDIGFQVADALAHAHRAGIIHRDIKPSNIILTRDNKAFVTDFGIAKVLNAAKKLTVDGSRLGTPQYMSPERCQNKKVTASSDIYALGVVLFKCMTGRLPYKGENAMAIMRSIVDDRPMRLRELAPDAPESVERLIAYMLEKNPEDRPPSARALCEAILRVRRGEVLEGDGDGMANAIKAFRATIPGIKLDPDTHLTPWTITRRIGPVTKEAVRSGWFALPAKFRIGIGAAVLVAALCVTLVSGYEIFMQPRVTAPDFGADNGVARWTAPQVLARIVDEQPGVYAIHFNTPGFGVSALSAPPGEESIYIGLTGAAGSPRDGQHLIASLNPKSLLLTVALAPDAAQRGQAFLMPGAGAPKPWGTGFYTATETGTRFVMPGKAPLRIAEQPATVLAPCPGSAYAALAWPDPANSAEWDIVELSLDAPMKEATRIASEAPVRALAYSPDGFLLAYLTGVEGGANVLKVIPSLVPDRGAVTIAEGPIAFGAMPFSPNGDRMVIARNAGQESMLEIVPTGEPGAPESLGPGQCAQWRPDGASIVALAPDATGKLQAMAIGGDAPHARTPLTAKETSAGDLLVLTGDGRHALVATANGASMLLVTLP